MEIEIIRLGYDESPENKTSLLKNQCITVLGEELVYDLKKLGLSFNDISYIKSQKEGFIVCDFIRERGTFAYFELRKMGCTIETIKKLGAYSGKIFDTLKLGKQY